MTTTLAPPPERTPTEPAPPLRDGVQAPLAPAPIEAPEPEQPPRRRGVLGGVILIAVGLVALVSNVLPTPGALLFLGLGAAFLIARVVTGRYGYAVPAGILLGFGTFIALTESGAIAGQDSGGLFFIMLGLGFIASYLIMASPARVWPLLPAAGLIGFGLMLQGFLAGWPFDQFVWLAAYWPLALILFGVWLLARDQLPGPWRTPVTIVGASVLIVVGLLVATAGMASVAAPMGRFTPFPAWPGFQTMPMFGTPPVRDTVVLNSPIAPGDTLRLGTASGRTTIRATAGDQVRVEAVRHYWSANNPPQVRLVPGAGAVSVEATQPFVGPGSMGYIDYVVDLPARAGADIGSTSGDVNVSGLTGPVTLHTVSGSIVVNDLSGDGQFSTTSGAIRGANVDRVREARSTSGGIDLIGAFTADANVTSTSGGVTLQFEPGASARIDASTQSGGIRTSGGGGTASSGDARSRTFTLGAGAAHAQVRTTSGGISLNAR